MSNTILAQRLPMRSNDLEKLLTHLRGNPTQFAQALLGWTAHPKQAEFLRTWRAANRQLLTGRRWGKSEALALDALCYAVFQPNSRQLIASVSVDQARIVWDRILQFAAQSPLIDALVDARQTKETPFPEFTLKQGALITARATVRGGRYIRGHKFNRAFVDEVEYIDDTVVDEVIRMTLADTGGSLILASTPRKRGGLLWREIQKPNAVVTRGSSFDNPHIAHAYIEEQRARMTDAQWRREVLGEFVDDGEAVFGWSHIQAAFQSSDWVMPVAPDAQRFYVAGWDLAKHADYTVGIVLDATTTPFKLVHFDRFNQQPWGATTARIRTVAEQYHARTLIDATGIGDVVLDDVGDVAEGLVFTKKSKTDLLANLQVRLEQRQLQFPFVRELVDELQAYEWNDKQLTTDCVMALALAAWNAGPRKPIEIANPFY